MLRVFQSLLGYHALFFVLIHAHLSTSTKMRALLIFALLVKQGRIKKKRRLLREISESDYDREAKLVENRGKKKRYVEGGIHRSHRKASEHLKPASMQLPFLAYSVPEETIFISRLSRPNVPTLLYITFPHITHNILKTLQVLLPVIFCV